MELSKTTKLKFHKGRGQLIAEKYKETILRKLICLIMPQSLNNA
jgi:hypothetical protein